MWIWWMPQNLSLSERRVQRLVDHKVIDVGWCYEDTVGGCAHDQPWQSNILSFSWTRRLFWLCCVRKLLLFRRQINILFMLFSAFLLWLNFDGSSVSFACLNLTLLPIQTAGLLQGSSEWQIGGDIYELIKYNCSEVFSMATQSNKNGFFVS